MGAWAVKSVASATVWAQCLSKAPSGYAAVPGVHVAVGVGDGVTMTVEVEVDAVAVTCLVSVSTMTRRREGAEALVYRNGGGCLDTRASCTKRRAPSLLQQRTAA